MASLAPFLLKYAQTNMNQPSSNLAQLFSDPKLFRSAFVHRSYLNESQEFKQSNERLEYLGDAVLELVTSEFLYQQFQHYQEGMLTNLRAALVRTESLAATANKLGFSKLLLMSKGEEATGGRTNPSLLANTFEAFLGALYLDQGYSACSRFCRQELFGKLDEIIKTASYKDSKSYLQEIAQAKFKSTPAYQLIEDNGPDHNKVFKMVAVIGEKKYGAGEGKSKQAAQEAAARATLEMLNST